MGRVRTLREGSLAVAKGTGRPLRWSLAIPTPVSATRRPVGRAPGVPEGGGSLAER